MVYSLRRFSFHLPSKCFVPGCLSKDSIQHCFLHCFFVRTVWQFFEGQLQIQFGLAADLFSVFHSGWSYNERGADWRRLVSHFPLLIFLGHLEDADHLHFLWCASLFDEGYWLGDGASFGNHRPKTIGFPPLDDFTSPIFGVCPLRVVSD